MTNLVRKASWDADLQEYVDSKREADMPCAVFAAGAVEVMTSTDLLRQFKGRMTWARDNLVEAVDSVLERRPVAFARSGDLVMADGNVGVCVGDVAVFMALHEGQTGTSLITALDCSHAWTVG